MPALRSALAAALLLAAAGPTFAQEAPPPPDTALGGLLGPSISVDAARDSAAPVAPVRVPGTGGSAVAPAWETPTPAPTEARDLTADIGLDAVIDVIRPRIIHKGGAF